MLIPIHFELNHLAPVEGAEAGRVPRGHTFPIMDLPRAVEPLQRPRRRILDERLRSLSSWESEFGRKRRRNLVEARTGGVELLEIVEIPAADFSLLIELAHAHPHF